MNRLKRLRAIMSKLRGPSFRNDMAARGRTIRKETKPHDVRRINFLKDMKRHRFINNKGNIFGLNLNRNR